jgi:hypothetical protein
MVEIFFGIITRQAIRRGSFLSVDDLEEAIRRFSDAYNDRAKPFIWTKTTDELLAKITRNRFQTRETRVDSRVRSSLAACHAPMRPRS